MCGEQGSSSTARMRLTGSSPRVRGTVIARAESPRPCGIIPACAGNRWHRVRSSFPGRDHPRVCGEQLFFSISVTLPQGSSPRVRGTGQYRVFPTVLSGIIPACAGNRRLPRPHDATRKDHPRVCGEQLAFLSSRSLWPGSSPRVRGTGR